MAYRELTCDEVSVVAGGEECDCWCIEVGITNTVNSVEECIQGCEDLYDKILDCSPGTFSAVTAPKPAPAYKDGWTASYHRLKLAYIIALSLKCPGKRGFNI